MAVQRKRQAQGRGHQPPGPCGMNSLYQTIIEASNIAICYLNPSLDIQYSNPCFQRLLGYSQDSDILGRNILSLVPTALHRKVQCEHKKRQAGIGNEYELELVREDGALVHVAISCVPLFDQGIFMGSVGMAKDITKEKELAAQLELSRLRLQSVIDSVPAAIVEISDDSKFKYLNKSACLLLSGKSATKPHFRTLRQYIHESELQRYDQTFELALQGERQPVFSMDLVRSNKEVVPAIWSMARIAEEATGSGILVAIISASDLLASVLFDGRKTAKLFDLTARELLVAQYLSIGLSYKEIAGKLQISLATTRTHIQNTFRKTHVHSRSALLDVIALGNMSYSGRDTLMSILRRNLLASNR